MQQKHKMIIAGATGFIGTSLVEFFRKKFRIVILTRHIPESEKTDHQKDIEYVRWNDSNLNLQSAFKDCKILINLTGAGIGDKAWTDKRKTEILQSRIQSIKNLTGFMDKYQVHADLIIQASAIGYYGFDDNRVFVENDSAGKGFLAEVATSWEEAATELRPFAKRMV
ncbi:MAG: NAD-dependent epimerase/dehydratase family protein, partial [Bacteroidales bacterium]